MQIVANYFISFLDIDFAAAFTTSSLPQRLWTTTVSNAGLGLRRVSALVLSHAVTVGPETTPWVQPSTARSALLARHLARVRTFASRVKRELTPHHLGHRFVRLFVLFLTCQI
jgi:hypothetical protein